MASIEFFYVFIEIKAKLLLTYLRQNSVVVNYLSTGSEMMLDH